MPTLVSHLDQRHSYFKKSALFSLPSSQRQRKQSTTLRSLRPPRSSGRWYWGLCGEKYPRTYPIKPRRVTGRLKRINLYGISKSLKSLYLNPSLSSQSLTANTTLAQTNPPPLHPPLSVPYIFFLSTPSAPLPAP